MPVDDWSQVREPSWGCTLATLALIAVLVALAGCSLLLR
jgi:hypothetical protein